jgi:hypothetical protein
MQCQPLHNVFNVKFAFQKQKILPSYNSKTNSIQLPDLYALIVYIIFYLGCSLFKSLKKCFGISGIQSQGLPDC